MLDHISPRAAVTYHRSATLPAPYSYPDRAEGRVTRDFDKDGMTIVVIADPVVPNVIAHRSELELREEGPAPVNLDFLTNPLRLAKRREDQSGLWLDVTL